LTGIGKPVSGAVALTATSRETSMQVGAGLALATGEGVATGTGLVVVAAAGEPLESALLLAPDEEAGPAAGKPPPSAKSPAPANTTAIARIQSKRRSMEVAGDDAPSCADAASRLVRAHERNGTAWNTGRSNRRSRGL
jgi:hypothetical protein